MTARTIPFTRSQRATIRTTGLLMLPIGLLLSWSGVTALRGVLPVLQVLFAWPIAVMALHGAVEAALGLALLIGGALFVRAASQGTIAALVGGLRALCVVFAVKAALLLLVVAGLLFSLLGAPLLF